jgi:SET domain-containing protein
MDSTFRRAEGRLKNFMQNFVADTENELVAVETEFAVFKTSRIHGTGGFARVNIPAGTRIIEYVGEKIPKAESNRRCEANNEYIFIIDDDYDLDGSVSWNPARFINHSCAPNCEAEWDEERIWIVALRDLGAGEELTFNYGYELEDYREHPCKCGAAECVGYIVAEEFFERVKRKPEAS